MEGFEEQQYGEQGDKLWIEVVSKNGERQAGLGQCIPEALHQMLELGRS
jgi:hypothetical protein